MQRLDHALLTIHTAFLSVALGMVLLVGITAAVAFSLMGELDVYVQEFAAVTDPHNRLLPGLILHKLFGVTDGLVAGCVLLSAACIVTIGARLGRAGLTPLGVLQIAACVVLIGLTLYQSLIFRPPLTENLNRYHELARQGSIEQAQPYKDAFDEEHTRASFLLTTQAGLLFVAILLTCVRQASVSPINDVDQIGDGG